MDKIINKVKKLFDLAENNNSEAEAQAALTMARRLLQEHGLSMMDIEVEPEKGGLAGEVSTSLDGRKRLSVWMIVLGDVIADYFDVGFLYRNIVFSHKVGFYGNKANAQAALVAMPSLVSQIEALAKKYKNPTQEYYYGKNRRLTMKMRESYRLGLIEGFAQHLILMKKKDQEYAQTTALAVFNEDLKKEWLDATHLVIGVAKRPQKTVNEQAFSHGQRDSTQLSLQKSLSK